MVSTEEDPGFVARAILVAKAKKLEAERNAGSGKGEAKRSQGRKKAIQKLPASEEEGSSTAGYITRREKRMRNTTTNPLENRRSGRQKKSIVDYSPGGRRKNQKVCSNVGHDHVARLTRY